MMAADTHAVEAERACEHARSLGIDCELLSSESVKHRADTRGIVVGRVDRVRLGERTFEHTYWYTWDAPGCPIHHMDSREVI
jgi:hypothetical protein